MRRYRCSTFLCSAFDAVPSLQCLDARLAREQGRPACLDARDHQRCVISPVSCHRAPSASPCLASHTAGRMHAVHQQQLCSTGRPQRAPKEFMRTFSPVHVRYVSLLHHSSHGSQSHTATIMPMPEHRACCTYRSWPKQRQPQVRVLTSAIILYHSIALSDRNFQLGLTMAQHLDGLRVPPARPQGKAAPLAPPHAAMAGTPLLTGALEPLIPAMAARPADTQPQTTT